MKGKIYTPDEANRMLPLVSRIADDIERDYILRGENAVAYGLVDTVVHHASPFGEGLARPDERNDGEMSPSRTG